MDGIRVDKLPFQWNLVPLGNFCEFGGGTQPPKNTFKNLPQEGYIRLLQIRDFESDAYAIYISNNRRFRIIRSDDISIARYGASIGRILTGKAGAINVAIMTTFPDETKITKPFLRFILQLNDFQRYLKGLGGRAAQAGFNKGEIKKFYFPLPPLPEQRRIAHVLSTVQTAIEQQTRMIALTRELKSMLMRKLFTEGLRGEKQKETELGLIPESWEILLLDACAVVQTGTAKGRSIEDDESLELPYLRVANVQDGYLDLKEIKTIRIRVSERDRYLLRNGDVVLTEGGDFDKLGRGFIWRGQIENCVHQNHIFAVRVNSDKLLSEFFAYQSQSPYGKKYFLSVAHKTSNLACINTAKLKRFPVLIPKLDEQEQIAHILKTVDEKLSNHSRKHDLLEELFRTLLHQLMTGQTRVNDIDLPGLL